MLMGECVAAATQGTRRILITLLSKSVLMLMCFKYFFFSSRRRHTRLTCDWSSDVCSSDLIPKGANVEMLVKTIAKNQFALDLDSVTVNGRRYGVQTQDSVVSSQADGLGANKRTVKFVGGGAVIGAIVGAITGGGKGAAIGGGIGAAAGAGSQVLTRGKSVNVPAESLVTFRLEQPLQTGTAEGGFNRNGQHYHPGYK